jgi:hypothetical protein
MKGRLGPVRSEFYCISVVVSGTHTIELGLEEYHLQVNSLFFTSPNQIFSKYNLSADTFGYYILFKANFLDLLIASVRLAEEFPFFDYISTPLFQLASEEIKQLESFLF